MTSISSHHSHLDTAGQVARFGVVGGSCFLLSLALYALFLEAGLAYLPAGIVAYAIGAATGFVANRSWTFDAGHGPTRQQAPRYLVVNLLAIATNAALLVVFVDVTALREITAEVVAMVLLAPSTFVANRLWTFRPAG